MWSEYKAEFDGKVIVEYNLINVDWWDGDDNDLKEGLYDWQWDNQEVCKALNEGKDVKLSCRSVKQPPKDILQKMIRDHEIKLNHHSYMITQIAKCLARQI